MPFMKICLFLCTTIVLNQVVQADIGEAEYFTSSDSSLPDMLEISEPSIFLNRQRRAASNISSDTSTVESTMEPSVATPAPGSNDTDMITPDTDLDNSTLESNTSELNVSTTPETLTTSTPKPTTKPFNTTTIRDDHQYYISHTYNEPAITTPYLAMFRKKFVGVTPSHDFLKQAYGRVKLFTTSFKFLFYGHSLNHIAITTGGFLYMSDFLHPHLTHSQYIAPLMGQFHTIKNHSDIYHVDDGSSFWVLWKDVYLYGKETAGPFTFYTVIHANGSIVIAYEKLPILPKDLTGVRKMGLSDAFYRDVIFAFSIRIRRIYRYHTMEIDPNRIRSGSVVAIEPLPTCHQLTSCSDCLSGRTNFTCSWCPSVGRCSSGIDRKRQEWVEKSCHLVAATKDCNITNTVKPTVSSPSGKPSTVPPRPPNGMGRRQKPTKGPSSALQAGLVFLILTIVVSVGVLGIWCRYAYTHPSSPSGIWLLEHRPSVLKEKMTSCFRDQPNSGERYHVSFNSHESVA